MGKVHTRFVSLQSLVSMRLRKTLDPTENLATEIRLLISKGDEALEGQRNTTRKPAGALPTSRSTSQRT